MGKTCFFIGHKNTPPSVMPDLASAIERHILECGVTNFIIGGSGAFDSMAARAVASAKQRHPLITLTRLLPRCPAAQPELLPDYFDGCWYPNDPEPLPGKSAWLEACSAAIMRADYLICYRVHSHGDAARLVDQAEILAQTLPVTLTLLPAQPIPF